MKNTIVKNSIFILSAFVIATAIACKPRDYNTSSGTNSIQTPGERDIQLVRYEKNGKTIVCVYDAPQSWPKDDTQKVKLFADNGVPPRFQYGISDAVLAETIDNIPEDDHTGMSAGLVYVLETQLANYPASWTNSPLMASHFTRQQLESYLKNAYKSAKGKSNPETCDASSDAIKAATSQNSKN